MCLTTIAICYVLEQLQGFFQTLQEIMLKKVFFNIFQLTFIILVQERVEGNVTTVSLVDVPENPTTVYFNPEKLLKKHKKAENSEKMVNFF